MKLETEADLQRLITDQISESLSLDYKRAASLDRKKTDEITKDISAFANSAGGVLIYGMAESKPDQRPTALDPVDRQQFSQEWLEQIISGVQPRLEFEVKMVRLSSGPEHVAYVVNIPQGSTAHQARDLRYHKRQGTITVAMQDFEIRDAMNRQKHPALELKLVAIENEYVESNAPGPPAKKIKGWALSVSVVNVGRVYARYVQASLKVPWPLLHVQEVFALRNGKLRIDNSYIYECDNCVPSRYDNFGRAVDDPQYRPILPGRTFPLTDIRLRDDWLSKFPSRIEWELFADNAPVRTGAISTEQITKA